MTERVKFWTKNGKKAKYQRKKNEKDGDGRKAAAKCFKERRGLKN